MKKEILIAIGITILFLGVGIQPAIAKVEPKKNTIDIEPKDYLFQTIIDIANNPEVKELLEKYNHNLFTSDYEYKDVYRQLLLKNPRLLFSMLFTKPSISVEYLDRCYNKGIEVTNIIGEDKASEIIESIEVIDLKVIDKLNNIIFNDKEISYNIASLKDMNKDVKSRYRYPIICNILTIIMFVLFLIAVPFSIVAQLYESYGLFPNLADKCYDVITIMFFLVGGLIVIGCLICSYDFPYS